MRVKNKYIVIYFVITSGMIIQSVLLMHLTKHEKVIEIQISRSCLGVFWVHFGAISYSVGSLVVSLL